MEIEIKIINRKKPYRFFHYYIKSIIIDNGYAVILTLNDITYTFDLKVYDITIISTEVYLI